MMYSIWYVPSSSVVTTLCVAGPLPWLLMAEMEQLYEVNGVNPPRVKVPAAVYCMEMVFPPPVSGTQERE